jgi:hypothetical protein
MDESSKVLYVGLDVHKDSRPRARRYAAIAVSSRPVCCVEPLGTRRAGTTRHLPGPRVPSILETFGTAFRHTVPDLL